MIKMHLQKHCSSRARGYKPMVALCLSVVFLLLTVPGQQALAHHSAGMFDRTKKVERQATVREFQWTYPHIWIQINITNDKKEVEEWSIEGGVPAHLYRRGWRPGSFKPGDNITIVYNPMRDGGKAGLFIGAKLADGKVLGKLE